MNSIFSLVQLLVFYFFIPLICSQPLKPLNLPLIFNTQTHQIYLTWKSITDDGSPYAIACPASYNNETIDQYEVTFEKEHSFNLKSIIVRNVVKNTLVDFTRKECTKGYQLSVAVHSPPNEEKIVEIGYEVFFEKSRFGKDFKESIYKYFQPTGLSDYDTIKRKDVHVPIMEREKINDLVNNNITKVPHEMGFAWLSKITIKFDFSSLSLKNATYFLDESVDAMKMNVKCDDSYLGIQIYKTNRPPSEYYEDTVQISIFSRVRMPKVKDNHCGDPTHKNCVIPYNLVPSYQFQSPYSSLVSCSQLTMIPLWNNRLIENVLDYFEKFLAALTQVSRNELKITAGVRDVLSFPSQYAHENKPLLIYMNFVRQENHFPVPKIIYKIVSYQLPECQEGEDMCWFDAVIVFHNQPVVLEEDKICNEDKCASWGYDSIQYLGTTNKTVENKSKFVYCCELDAEMRASLGHPKGKELDLKNFPYHDKEKKMQTKNIQEDVEKKMEELFGMEAKSKDIEVE